MTAATVRALLLKGVNRAMATPVFRSQADGVVADSIGREWIDPGSAAKARASGDACPATIEIGTPIVRRNHLSQEFAAAQL